MSFRVIERIFHCLGEAAEFEQSFSLAAVILL